MMIAAEAYTVNREFLEHHFDELDPVVAFRMRAGKDLPAPDYVAIWRQWKALRDRINHTLRDVDALIVPTTMIPALPLEAIDTGPARYAECNAKYLRNTSLGNILNLCAVSVPCGFTTEGLPIGMMIYAKPCMQLKSWLARRI